jgi:pimeloyl-ACP methyl ester carboxylesterase
MKRFQFFTAILAACLMASTLPTFAQAQAPLPEDETSAETRKLDELERRRSPRGIQFGPCPENAAAECGTLSLPVDYNNPHGETFDMAVIRAKAFDPAKRIGVIVLNPGGPASSGVDFVLGGIGVPAFDGLRTGFDVVGFDVRGSQRSRPVKCDVQPRGELDGLPDEEVIARIDEFSRRFAQTCVEQNGPFILSITPRSSPSGCAA